MEEQQATNEQARLLDTPPTSPKPSLLSRVKSAVASCFGSESSAGVELLSVNRSEYTELDDDEGKEEEKEEEKKTKPEDRFFEAVAIALLDRIKAKPELRLQEKFKPLFNIDFHTATPKILSGKLREMCAKYATDLDAFSRNAKAQAFLGDKYWAAFQQHQDNTLRQPKHSHIVRGYLPNEAREDRREEPVFFTEKPLKSSDMTDIAGFFLKPSLAAAPQKILAKVILETFFRFKLSATLEFCRLRHNYDNAPNEEAKVNIKEEMQKYCLTPEAIKSYFFDETRLSAIYYSDAFNNHFENHDLPRGDKTELVDYIMMGKRERAAFREELGAEVMAIFQRNPAFSTTEFKRLNDVPVYTEEDKQEKQQNLKRYCESREAIEWYVIGSTDYQKYLHYLQGSRILYSSKMFFLATLASLDDKTMTTAKHTLQDRIADALKTCREEFPDIALPENYEILCKKFNGIGKAAEAERPNVLEEMTNYVGSNEAYFWYVKTYLAQPNALFPEECLNILRSLDKPKFSVRIWQQNEDSQELRLANKRLAEESSHTLDAVIVPNTIPTAYRILNRFNFNPLGEYTDFCNKYISLALETLQWIKKTLGPKYPEYLNTIGKTHAGCPEIDGVIICELLAKAEIPISLFISHPHNSTDYSFVYQDGCAHNVPSIENRVDSLTLLIEQDTDGFFLPILSSKSNEEFYEAGNGRWNTEIKVDLAFGRQLSNEGGSAVTTFETVQTKTPDGRKGTTEAIRDTLQYVAEKTEYVVAKKIDDETIPELPELKNLRRYVVTPIETKTSEELALEAAETNNGFPKNNITLKNTLTKAGELHSGVKAKAISYREIPAPAVMEPFEETEAVPQRPTRPPMPSFKPYAPVTLAAAIQPGFTHNALPEKEVEPPVVLPVKIKDNHFFKAVADGLNNVIIGTSNVSGEIFYTEEYLREACDNHLVHNLPAKNWVQVQLNSDPDNADYFKIPDTKGKAQERPGFEDVPLTSDSKTKKTPYRTYIDEVRHPFSEEHPKTLDPKIDVEAHLLCEALNDGTQIHILEVREEDIPNDKGEFSRHKVVQKRYLYTSEGRREVNAHDVNWNSAKTITLIYDQDTDHFESANSYLPRTVLFKVINGSVHAFLLLNLTLAMSGQGGAALVQIINEGYSAALAGFVGWGALAGKVCLLGFYTVFPFGGHPSTASSLALKIYNGADHIAKGWKAFHTGNWSLKEDIAPVIGMTLVAAIPAVFFGALNGPTLQAFSSTVHSTPGLNDSSFFIALANLASTEGAFRLTCFSSALANLLSAGPILDGVTRTTSGWINDGKKVFSADGTGYERVRFVASMVGGAAATGIATTGWLNFWDISTNVLFPGSGFGVALGVGIMPFISLLGYTATFPLGYKFAHHLCDFAYGDGPRAWLKENMKGETPGSVTKYVAVTGVTLVTVGMGGLPNVFQAKTLAHQTGALPYFALVASALTELEGTQMCFLLIANKAGNLIRKNPSNEEAEQQSSTSWKEKIWRGRNAGTRYGIWVPVNDSEVTLTNNDGVFLLTDTRKPNTARK